MNYGQYRFQYGADGRDPERQDASAGQAITPHLGSHPAASTQMSSDFSFHSTPLQPNPSGARFAWHTDNPLPPLPELLPILPAHRIHSSAQMSNVVLDLTVGRQLSVPCRQLSGSGLQLSIPSRQSSVSRCSEEPIDMSVSSRAASDQANSPLALTNKNRCDQANVMDSPRSHPKNLCNLQKLKKSPRDDQSSGFLRQSDASTTQDSDAAAALEVSPRRVTRQSVRSGQAALTPPRAAAPSAATKNLSPASTMEAVEGLLMLPQLTNPEASPPEANPTARLLRIPRKGLRPMRLQAERSAAVSTPLDSCSRTSVRSLADSFTHLAIPGSPPSEVRSAAKGTSIDIRDRQQLNSVVSTVVVSAVAPLPVASRLSTVTTQTSATGSVVAASNLATLHEATVQNLKRSGAKTNLRERIFTVTRERSAHVEDREVNVVPESSGDTGRFSSSIVETDCMHSYAGSVLSDVCAKSSKCGSVLDADSKFMDTTSVPLDSTFAHNAGSMPTDNDPIPTDTVCMPSDVHSIPTDAVSTPDAGTMPIETGPLSADADPMPTYTDPLPPDTDFLPTDNDLIPTYNDPMLIDTDSIPTETYNTPNDTDTTSADTDLVPTDIDPITTDCDPMPTDTDPMPPDTDPLTTDNDPIPTYTDPMPTDDDPMPLDTDSSPTDSDPIPTDTDPIPPDTDSMPTDTDPMPTDTLCMPSDIDSMSTDTFSFPADTSSMSESPAVHLNRQIASLASLDLSQTKQLILSLYRHLETLERSQVVGDTADRSANSIQATESHDVEHDTCHNLSATPTSRTPPQLVGDTADRSASSIQATESHDVEHDTCHNLSATPTSGTPPQPVGDTADRSASSIQATESHNIEHDTSHDLPATPTSRTSCQPVGDTTDRGSKVAESRDTEQRRNDTSHDIPATPASRSPCQEQEMLPREKIDSNVADANSDTVMTNDDHDKTENEKSDNSLVETEGTALLANTKDNSHSADETVSAEALNASHADKVLPPAIDKLPVEVVRAVSPPLDPMAMESDDRVVEVPLGCFAVPFTTVGELFHHHHHHEQPVVVFVNSPHCLDTVAFDNHCLSPVGSNALYTQSVDEVQPYLPPSQQVTLMESHVCTSQQVTMTELHLHTSQPVTPMEPHFSAAQNVALLRSHTCSSQHTLPLEPHSVATRQISPEPVEHHFHQVSILEPVILTSEQVTVAQPHWHVLTGEQVSTMELCSIAGHQVSLEPNQDINQQVSGLEPHTLSDHKPVSFEHAITTSPQKPLLEPHLMTSQQVPPLEPSQVFLMEPEALSSQEVSSLEPHLTSQQVPLMEPEALVPEALVPQSTSQQVPLMEPESLVPQSTSQQVPVMDPESMTSQQVVSALDPQSSSQQVCQLESQPISQQLPSLAPVSITSERVHPLEPEQVPSLELEKAPSLDPGQVPQPEPEHVLLMEPEQIPPLQREQVPQLEPEPEQIPPLEQEQVLLLEPEQTPPPEPERDSESMTSEQNALQEHTMLIGEQYVPLPGAGPLMAEESGTWVVCSSYQSSLQLEAISPPSSVRSTNDLEEAEEYPSTNIFYRKENLERSSGRPAVEFGSEVEKLRATDMGNVEEDASSGTVEGLKEQERGPGAEVGETKEQLQVVDVENAEENASVDIIVKGGKELDGSFSHPSMAVVSDRETEEVQLQVEPKEASGLELLENDGLDDELEISRSPVPSTTFEDVLDTVELGNELLQSEVVHFEADDLTEVVANEEVETVDFDDQSLESLSLRLSISSDDDGEDLAARLSECVLAEDMETPQSGMGNSNENMVELYAEQLGTVVQVDPNHLPKDITSLFNCNVVVKMLNPSQSPDKEAEKKRKGGKRLQREPSKSSSYSDSDDQSGKSMAGNENKKQKRLCATGISYVDYDDKILRMVSSEAGSMSQAKRTAKQNREALKQNREKTGRGFGRKRSAEDASAETLSPEVQSMYRMLVPSTDSDVAEPVQTGLTSQIIDTAQMVDNGPAVQPNPVVSAVNPSQEDDYKEDCDELAVDLNSRVVGVVVFNKPSEFNLSCVGLESNEEAVSFDPTGPNRDYVPGLESPVTTSSVLEQSVDKDVRDKSANAESNNRTVGKKICKISLSGLSKPPMLKRLSLFSPPMLDRSAETTASLAAIMGVSPNHPEDGTPVLDMNGGRREETDEIRSVVEPQVNDGREDRNIFQIKIPPIVDNFRAPVEPELSGIPGSVVTHDIDRMVLGLRTMFQDVIQRGESRDGRVSEKNQSEEGVLQKPSEVAETTRSVDSCQVKDSSSREGVADADSEGFGVRVEEVQSQIEGKSLEESETPVETGEMTGVCEAVDSSETTAHSGETPSGSSEMPSGSSETPSSLIEMPRGSSETPIGSSETPSRSSETPSGSSEMIVCANTQVNSVETVASSSERVVNSDETALGSIVEANGSSEIVASGGPANTYESSTAICSEPVLGLSETSKRNYHTDDDDDNENTFFEPMDEDNTSDIAFDSKENPIGRSSLDENSPQEEFSNRKRKFPTNPDILYPVQIRSTKRSRLTELNCGQPREIVLETETVFIGTDLSRPAATHGGSPRRNAASQQASSNEIRTCGESIITFRNVVEQSKSEKSVGSRVLKFFEDDPTESGFQRPDTQPDNHASTGCEPQPGCLWEMIDTAEAGLASSPGSPTRHTNQSPHCENSPESRPNVVQVSSPQLARSANESTSQHKSGDDLSFTSSSIPLLDSVNGTTDMVIRKLPINCSLVKSTSVNILSRAVSRATPGIKHLQCVFCDRLFRTMKGVAAHLEEWHADVVSFASFRINPSKDFTICYFCRHCQFVTSDRVIIWTHFDAAHGIRGILQSHDDGGTVADVYSGLPTELDLSLDSPVHWYRAFMCSDCHGLTSDEATMASHMSTIHPCSPCSNGHFAKVIALLRPRHHAKPLTYRMLLMNDAYRMNRKTCFVCLLCHFVVFDPRLALSHFLSLHIDMKLLLVCKSDSCNERFVREKSFVEHYQQRHKPKTIPTHLNCSVTLVTKSCEQEMATEVKFTDD